jgi:hypothetical protein
VGANRDELPNLNVKYWEIIADKITKSRTPWAGSPRSTITGERSGLLTRISCDGQRFIVHADDKLTAFLELETVIHEFAVAAMS